MVYTFQNIQTIFHTNMVKKERELDVWTAPGAVSKGLRTSRRTQSHAEFSSTDTL